MAKKKTAATNQTRTVTFIATVESESADDVHLFLDDDEVDLQQDGDKLSGTKTRQVGDSISAKLVVGGFDGTVWSAEIDIDCPEGEPFKVISKSGTIGEPNGRGFKKTLPIPESPCGE